MLAHFHFFIQPALFGHVADDLVMAVLKRLSRNKDDPGIGDNDIGDNADERCFSSTVRSQQSKNGAFFYFKRDVVISVFVAKGFGDILEGENHHLKISKLTKSEAPKGV